MTDLRERQRSLASDRVARERRTVAESEAQVRAAQTQLRQQQTDKSVLWSDTAAALGDGRCNVEHLRHVARWSQALTGKVRQATQGVQDAQRLLDQRSAVLEERLRVLRSANGNVEKARQMDSRLALRRRIEAEANADEALDEWASRRWTPPADQSATASSDNE